jgi:hypothetical protein
MTHRKNAMSEDSGKSRMPTLLVASLCGVAAIATGGVVGAAIAGAAAVTTAQVALSKRDKK